MKKGNLRGDPTPGSSPLEANGSPGQKKHKRRIGGKIVKALFGKKAENTEVQGEVKDGGRKPDVSEESQPVTAEQIRELIKDQKFFKAVQHLLVKEKGSNGNSGREEEKVEGESDVEALFGLLKQELLGVLRSSVVIAPSQPELLRDAVRAMVYLVEEDERSASGEKASGKARIRNWKEEWRNVVQASVAERMKDPPLVIDDGLSTTARLFLHMGRTMKDDLISVVQYMKPHYPEHFQVCSTYAKYYHHCFSSQLEMIAQFELGNKDTYLLLTWVENLYPNEIRNHPVLVNELDESSLGSLLSSRQIKQFEAAYRANEADSVKRWLAKCLEVEVARWTQEKEPEKLDGHFHSELPIDAIQTIHGARKRAKEISPDLGKEMSGLLLTELLIFLQSYKRELEIFIKENKQHRYFAATIIANINNCLSFRTHAEESTVSAKNDVKEKIFTTLNDIQNLGFDVLLKGLADEVQPFFKKFTQKKWISCTDIMDDIIAASSYRISMFKTLKDPLHQAIMEKTHIHLVREYITRLLKKRVSLRTPELQSNLSELVRKNASVLHDLCTENGSKATWLNSALPSLAEIIRLQDIDAIMVEVGVLANKYPDISKKHLYAILYIKGNLSNGDYKSILSVLELGVPATLPPTSLFAPIKVS
ncbi:tumor necrosis factor alpha-induced protein 2 isoform X2 [Elgaria multicarinata webbii]